MHAEEAGVGGEARIEDYGSVASAFVLEDFVPKDFVDVVVVVLGKRTAWEEAELEKHRCCDEEFDNILLEQGIAAKRTTKEKYDMWHRLAEKEADL